MFNIKTTNNEKGRSIRFVILSLLSFEFALHDVNGMHLSLGFGVGPLELSGSLHHWDKW
tara:strand:- start:936 stop:1112 length:177 start_codon:yes stop_codon:yes gene_type:complete